MNAKIVIIGAGPAGLACAERLTELGFDDISIYEQKPSAARKFLMAGKTGLNISHNEPFEQFIARYDHNDWLSPMIKTFDAQAIREWMQGLGIQSYVGSSGRIFPKEMKAAPLLRAWLKRLQQRGIRFHYRHQVTALTQHKLSGIDLNTQQAWVTTFDVVVLACGGVSWPQLGSDGLWQGWINDTQLNPFQGSNVGVCQSWSTYMQAYFGQPLKRIKAWTCNQQAQFGEMVISHYGLEGGLVYRCNRGLRRQLQDNAVATLFLDLLPDVDVLELEDKLSLGKKQSLNTRWQKAGLDKTKIALLREIVCKQDWTNPKKMAWHIKQLTLNVHDFRPITEAISCAGGIRLDALDQYLRIKTHQNWFACGEMLDWDAPTGGYLLTACLATGRWVGEGVSTYLCK
ncbi:TIGR03862 family flavoprotein [Acinetobacter qingfengensis]|uniref:Flavoprotein n=1 Tax=Acinetobacter qingfengensis TaxID=1262585 RepID=A0A1E7R9Z4_9GAMM|nr:TIGR03862 family flavoprotein [Acinetobacter qingfengensis]KAA8733917.1 TIGR03862 family flavoprotein [Acinetobacter qingfengensis]OEY96164.1 flavoprotein [Acinetobacter qingfengensis]